MRVWTGRFGVTRLPRTMTFSNFARVSPFQPYPVDFGWPWFSLQSFGSRPRGEGGLLLCRCCALQLRRLPQMLGESPLVGDQRKADGPVHAKLLHLRPGFLSRPVFNRHAISRDHHSSAVIAIAAV